MAAVLGRIVARSWTTQVSLRHRPQVFSSRPSFLDSKLALAEVTLVTGLVATIVSALLMLLIVLTAHGAWLWSMQSKDQLLMVVRARQDMQGAWQPGAAVGTTCIAPAA